MAAIQAGAGFWFYQLQTLDELSSIAERKTLPPLPLAPDNAELRDGDVVFLWVGGAQPGLRGWGIARLGAPSKSVASDVTLNVLGTATANRLRRPSLTLDVRLAVPVIIPARRLAMARGLSDAPLIRQTQTGTFFRLSAEQAFELCELLSEEGHPAPVISVADVLDPIARRVERELIGIGKLVPEVLPAQTELLSSAESSLKRLWSGGLLGAYEPLRSLIESLGSVVSSAQGERASLLAPLSAARTRLLNDVHQVARLTDAAARTRAALDAVRDTEDEWAFPTDDTATRQRPPVDDATVVPSRVPPMRVDVDEQTAMHPDEKTEVYADEQTAVYPDEKTEVYAEQRAARRDEKTEVYPDEQTAVRRDEKTAAYSDEKTEVYPDERTEVFPDERTEVFPDEKTAARRDEKTAVYPDEKTIAYTDEKTIAYADEKTVVDPDEQIGVYPDEDATIGPWSPGGAQSPPASRGAARPKTAGPAGVPSRPAPARPAAKPGPAPEPARKPAPPTGFPPKPAAAPGSPPAAAPGPVPRPAPGSASKPAPAPGSAPRSAPAPGPAPTLAPAPGPAPELAPAPGSAPKPAAAPGLTPRPPPGSAPKPAPAPGSAPRPAPEPRPAAAPSPAVAPQPPGPGRIPAAADPAARAARPKTPPPAQPAPVPGPTAAPKDPLFRHWEQSDLIGIGAAVNNLARYISHEGLLPPVAIGVFGDWGSGKSFFIRALQSQIALLSSQSRDALAANRTTVFCSHIVQIEFNAWHFVESNLWASLAAHIFERLYAELERRGAAEGANRNIDGLYQQFSAYKQAVSEQQRLKKLVDSLAIKRDQAYAKKLAAEKSVKARLLALTDVAKNGIKELAAQKLTPGERKRLGDLLNASNIEDLDAAADDAIAIAKEGQGLFGRIKVQWSWWGGWQFALFAALAALVAFGLPLLLPWILGAQADNLQKAITLLGGYVATATIMLGWLARGGRQLVTAARKVESVLKDVRTRVESLPDRALDDAKREVAAAQAELSLVEQQIVDQRNRLAELADEVDPNQLGTRLQAFLEARVKDDAYQKHLGLISLVRKDFSALYELMQKFWQQRKRPVPEVLAEVRNALGEAARAQVPFIERIVLYIDDLDRCPEDKVVEVLQAVHLMLGLPLFVVVVAVDVRWVGESIRKHYGKLVDQAGSASADDYLEKIFQIPYRIHPMEPDVRKLLLSGLMRQPYLSATGERGASQTPAIIQQELVPKEFSLYPEEQAVIEQLNFIVGSSPRRVRRFLDVYRLMRAGMEEGDVQELIAKKHYVVILALFAMLSGAPRAAPRIIELLRQEAVRTVEDEGDGDEERASAFTKQTLERWHEQVLRETTYPLDEMEVVRNAMCYMDALNVARPDLLATLRRWIPEIARYSFREVRMHRL